jgi:hypothetical protein
MSEINQNYKDLLKKVESAVGTRIGFSNSKLSEAGTIAQSQNNLIIQFLIEILARLDHLESKNNLDVASLTNQFANLQPIERRPKAKAKRDIFGSTTILEKYGTKSKQI